MRSLYLCITLCRVMSTYPLCVVQDYSPQWAPSLGNGTVVVHVTDCPATASGIWCKFDGKVLARRFSFLADIINETHVACATPKVDFSGRTRFGISGSEHAEPIEWFGFRFDPLIENTYEVVRYLFEQEQIQQAKLKWPPNPEGTDMDDVRGLDVPLVVSASRNISLVEGGPNVVLNVTNIKFDESYECLWRAVDDWTILTRVSARPYYPDQVICDITPSVSSPTQAALLLYMRGRPVRGAAIPFAFVANDRRAHRAENCTHPDGLCSLPNSRRMRAAFFLEEEL